MNLAAAVALVGLVAIALYAVLGGADFGGGVWDLLASGPRAAEQRRAIARAMGPVWEANHVWLIFVVVLLFTCFPPVFAALSVALYVPLVFVLLGIVLRGAAFAFRAHAHAAAGTSRAWGGVFGIASTITPFFFGTAAGAVALGVEPNALSGAWFAPFSLALGAFALGVCAQLAAVFLTLETDGPTREDFRRRAMRSTFAVAALGAVALAVGLTSAAYRLHGLVLGQGAPWVIAAMLLGLVVFGALWRGAYALARVAVAAEVCAILAGWYAAQAPYLIPGRFTLADGAAPPGTLGAFLVIFAGGLVFLVPALWLLFAVFKGQNPAAEGD